MNNIVKINYYKNNLNNHCLNFIFLSKKYTKDDISKCQNVINNYYNYAEKNNLKYNLYVDLTNLYLNNLSDLDYSDFFILYKINKNNTNKYVKNITILIKNNIIRKFLKIFAYMYKIHPNLIIL